MLALEDPRWSELSQAYGHAAGIPKLLADLAASKGQARPNDEPFFSLWSSLCHQGDVYTASYAAVPHIVQMAISTKEPIDFNFFLLPASIEVARHNGRGPEVPAFLAEAYKSSVAQLPESVAVHMGEAWSSDALISAVASQAVGKGHHAVAEAIMNLDDDLIRKINQQDWD
jgi:hypothetical protein